MDGGRRGRLQDLEGVSCPSSGLCVAVDRGGNVVTSTNPTGGATAWTVTHVDGSNGLDSVSCPSSGLCVAVDDAGNVVTSTNPTGGASAWTVTHVDGSRDLNSVSCPSSSLCVTVDDAGDVVTSTNPTGGAGAWTVSHVDGFPWLYGVSCPSSGLCVAVDGNGNVVTSTDPAGGAAAWTVTISDSLQDVPSTQQYLLHGSDGTTWEAMDTDLLADTFSPTTTGTAVLSANADLWTFDAGFNQDLGICLVPDPSPRPRVPRVTCWPGRSRAASRGRSPPMPRTSRRRRR